MRPTVDPVGPRGTSRHSDPECILRGGRCGDASCDFLWRKGCRDRQQAESHHVAGRFDPCFVDDAITKHLQPAADAEDGRACQAGRRDGVPESARAEPFEVGDRRLRARNDDQIGRAECGCVADESHAYAALRGERLEFVEIGDPRESHDGDVDDRVAAGAPLKLAPLQRILGRQVREVEVREDAERRDARAFAQHREARIEERRVATEFVDDETLN